MSKELVAKLVEGGVLPRSYKKELLDSFDFELFGGLYDQMEHDGIEFLFPECKPKWVAHIVVLVNSTAFKKEALARLFKTFDLPDPGDVKQVNFREYLAGIPGVVAVSDRNYAGDLQGLTWSFWLGEDGRLNDVHAHLVELIAKNSEHGFEEWTAEGIRKSLYSPGA
jgi:hypothetical protein